MHTYNTTNAFEKRGYVLCILNPSDAKINVVTQASYWWNSSTLRSSE